MPTEKKVMRKRFPPQTGRLKQNKKYNNQVIYFKHIEHEINHKCLWF